MQLGTQTNGLGGPSFRTSLEPSVAVCSCNNSTSLPQLTNHHSLITAHKSALASSNPLHSPLLIANDKLLESELTPSGPTPNAFLIANICPTFFSPAPPRAFLIGTRRLLEVDLTHSQQTRKHFLIGTIRPALTSAPHRARRQASGRSPFLFDTNESHKIVVPMKTKEKRVSIRYEFAVRGTGNLACAPFSRRHRTHCTSSAAKSTGRVVFRRQAELSHWCCASRLTKEDSPITNHAVLVPPSRAAVK
jgi:hypothetical protein